MDYLIRNPRLVADFLNRKFVAYFRLRLDTDLLLQPGFFTWHRRPKSLGAWPIPPQPQQRLSNIGIVIQGPIVTRNEFTLETVRLYRHLYPEVPIVLSTWKISTQSLLKEFLSAGAFVIQNEKVDHPYYGNLNLQQKTSREGLSHLSKLGLQFALKTRSDQRLYSESFLQQLIFLTEVQPRNHGVCASGTSRIFVTYQNSFIDRALSVSDFTQFGQTKELLQLWESIDSRSLPKALAPEQVLLGSYLLSLGWDEASLLSPATYERAMGEILGFVESSSLDLLWYKYSSREYLRRRYGRIFGPEPLRELSAADWYSALLVASKKEM